MALIKHLHEASEPVEEVFAIRSSLLEALKIGIIENDDIRQQLIVLYKKKYEKAIRIFPLAYDALDFVAGKIGGNAAEGLILSVFGTFNPILAFSDIISTLTGVVIPTNWLCSDSTEWDAPPNASFEFLWKLSDEFTASLVKLSVNQAYNAFSGLINALDTEASHLYKKADVLDEVLNYEKELLNFLKKEFSLEGSESDDFFKDDFFEFLCGSPTSFVLTSYTDFIHPFSLLKLDGLKAAGVIRDKFEYGDINLVIEAIIHQLTAGIGLLCPFWIDKPPTCPPTCCGNRELFQKIWSCTKPNSSCKSWKQMGCLAKEPVVYDPSINILEHYLKHKVSRQS